MVLYKSTLVKCSQGQKGPFQVQTSYALFADLGSETFI